MSIKYLVFPNFPVFQVIHELFLKIISNPLIILFQRNTEVYLPKEDPFHFPLPYCRQRSNLEIGASLIILRACPTTSSKPFLLECRMKGHGGVATASWYIRYKSDDQYGIEIILLKKNLQENFLYGAGHAVFESVTQL